MKVLFLNILSILLICSCQSKPEKASETEEKKVPEAEWISLFDGSSTDGWRAYNGDKLPPQWIIKDKTLTFDSGLKELDVEHQGGRDIIYAAEEFDNFELYLEWKIPEGGNSGIFYHVKEGYDGPPSVAPEYQLIDDINYAKLHDLTAYNKSVGFENPSQLHPLQQTASDYAMTAADPAKKVFHPAGEWNTTRIIFTPEIAEHWLNGKKVLSFVPWSDEWNAKKNSGKWEGAPDYGKFKTGYIGLQDHDSPLWFRNIKIKKL